MSKTREKSMILVVDDDEDILELFALNLSLLGFEVLLATGAAQALQHYRRAGPDIAAVIVDLSFPGGSGRELLQAIRALDPAARVIVCSGDSAAPEMCQPERFGFDAALEKRFDRERMAALLQNIMGQGQ